VKISQLTKDKYDSIYEVPRVAKFIEAENRMVVSEG
jgi:hypothetical protein